MIQCKEYYSGATIYIEKARIILITTWYETNSGWPGPVITLHTGIAGNIHVRDTKELRIDLELPLKDK